MAECEPKTKTVKPYAFIMGFGFVSMFMDIVYQAALSVQGPLLASLGASALLIGLISGLGEATSLVGRLFSGPLADRTGRYWLFAIAGYAATGLAVPAMGFVGSLGAVAFLIIFERFGKSLRTPSRDAMLSHAAGAVGRGKGFALHEIMDQIGAMGGPLMVSALLFATGNDYRIALGLMIIPGCLALISLFFLKNRVPDPRIYEQPETTNNGTKQADNGDIATVKAAESNFCVTDKNSAYAKTNALNSAEKSKHPKRREVAPALPGVFWLYTVACGIMLAGVATFGVLSFHMVSTDMLADSFVPLLYAIAMGIDAVFAGVTGVCYDRMGTKVLLVLPFVCAAIPLFAYSNSLVLVIVGVVLWGASLGIQESTMRAAVGDMVSTTQRASAYGFFSMAVGIGSLVGGVVAGALYDVSIPLLIGYVIVIEAIALFMLIRALKQTSTPAA